ncbi:hypothetical protein [Streptomyces sp. WMMB303]|uniref:hypothetical protein n=1 Tax=Streptomyces sp. WMMB303 TaxID=3034154 RepID=UPI0023ED88F5|nr:hypothetical protein [Streptomyces sp. WMMB303]MDF4254611.1 hypothetical protein [Streptomyces sp. WMMB303]
MIQHMSMVFKAGGLKTGEGAFLMACANHTDAKGYVVAHMQQVADEAHMSLRTAQSIRARLERRKLVKAAPRYSPKNGAQIANLFRINLDLLKSMERKRKDYGATLIEELTFDEAPDEDPEEKPSSDPPADSAPPHADSAPPHADSAGRRGAESAPLLPPSSAPSSLSEAPDDADASDGPPGDEEREAAAPEPSAADVVVDAYAQALGRPLLNGSRSALRAQSVELLAAGYPMEWVADRAREMAAHPAWKDLIKHCDRSRVPLPGQAGRGRGAGGRERCPDHPARYRRSCVECAMAVPD